MGIRILPKTKNFN